MAEIRESGAARDETQCRRSGRNHLLIDGPPER